MWKHIFKPTNYARACCHALVHQIHTRITVKALIPITMSSHELTDLERATKLKPEAINCLCQLSTDMNFVKTFPRHRVHNAQLKRICKQLTRYAFLMS